MGNSLAKSNKKPATPQKQHSSPLHDDNTTPKIKRSRRRKKDDFSFHNPKRTKLDFDIPTSELSATPKIINNLTTSEYIYRTLFIEGVGSDITVSALNRTWNLH